MSYFALVLLFIPALVGLHFLRKYLFPLPAPLSAAHERYNAVDVVFALLLSSFLMYLAVAGFQKKVIVTRELLISSCVLSTLLIITLLGVVIGQRRNPISLFGLNWTTWRRNIPGAFFILLAAYPTYLLIQLSIYLLFGKEADVQGVVKFLMESKDWQDRAVLIIMAVVFAPLSEELIYRGYLHGVIRQYLGRWLSIIITSVMFALAHFHVPALLGLFLFGVLLALIYEKTRSLWAPIAVHSAFNAITVAVTILWPSAAI